MELWASLVSVLAFVVSGAALLIAWWQLLLQRDAAGGRGFAFGVGGRHRKVDTKGGVTTITDTYDVHVELVGNDRPHVGVHLERNGRPLERGDRGFVAPPVHIRRMTSEHDPIEWKIEINPDDARDVWVVLSWAEPFGEGLRTSGFRCKLDPLTAEYEQWRHYRTYRARREIERWGVRRRWAWVRRWLGKPRPLGEWRPYYPLELKPGQSLLYSRPDHADGE